ncbi:MAG: hypothetical protein K0S33_2581 [Bacteroidetes bacterium]|jgi:hypothetical protein|nr:hypothetical protein [Bacteroidota bacterium]
MKKKVLVFGSISGLIVTAFMVISTIVFMKNSNFEGSMVLGYASMLLAFSFIFVGIKQVRDKDNGGLITFGKAFKVGLFIALISSTFYVVTWLIEYYCFFPDFMDTYADHMIKQAEKSGATAAELNAQIKEMEGYKEMYKNPFWVIVMTYLEVLPIGLLATLVCALILKRKTPKQTPAAA